MQEHTGLILRLIVIANHRNRMLAHRIPDSIDAGDEDEAGDPLPWMGLSTIAFATRSPSGT
jgi:hypothetical protein